MNPLFPRPSHPMRHDRAYRTLTARRPPLHGTWGGSLTEVWLQPPRLRRYCNPRADRVKRHNKGATAAPQGRAEFSPHLCSQLKRLPKILV